MTATPGAGMATKTTTSVELSVRGPFDLDASIRFLAGEISGSPRTAPA